MNTKHQETLRDIEDNTFEEVDYPRLPPDDIVAYNELRSCADLNRMVNTGQLNINPDYQREIVWTPAAQTKFIDSLVKQLPIPSMCFSFDYKASEWQVIDGLQRMFTINLFLSDKNWILSTLKDIDPKIAGKSNLEMKNSKEGLHKYYNLVENLSIPITVLRCDLSKENHREYVTLIFQRLNSGGTKLTNQEIRNCIYNGPFNIMLKELNDKPNWKKIVKLGPDKRDVRFKKQELILRIIAFSDRYEKYEGRLSSFLDSYMSEHRKINEHVKDYKMDSFVKAANIIYDNDLLPDKASNALIEALFVGIIRNETVVDKLSNKELKERANRLQNHKYFDESVLRDGIAQKSKVIDRLTTSIDLFS